MGKDDLNKDKSAEKKKLTIKDLGPQKLVIILMCGILLIILTIPSFIPNKKNVPSSKTNTSQTESSKKSSTKATNETYEDSYVVELENRLKTMLKKVEGVGDAEVMITIKSSKEQVPLKDIPSTEERSNETDSQGGSRISSNVTKSEETVTATNSSGETAPYVIKELQPEIEGVLVIAQGGGDVSIISEIVDAVQVLFDVPVHKIKVMKMD